MDVFVVFPIRLALEIRNPLPVRRNRGSAENRAAQGFDKGRRSGLGKCGHHSHNHQNRVRPQAHKLGRLIGLHTAIDAPL